MMNRIVRVLGIVALFLIAVAPASATVSGVVVTDAGEPVQGARIAFYSLESSQERLARWTSERPLRAPLALTETSSSGRFNAEWREATFVDIVVEAAGFAPNSLRVTNDEELGAVVLQRTDSLAGHVASAAGPVEGARVIWASDDGAEVIAQTGSDGRYAVPNPAAWASRQIVLHPSFSPRNVRLRGGPAPLEIAVEQGRPVEGTVTDRDGAVVQNASILVEGLPVARSGQDGRFLIAHVSRDAVVSALDGGNLGRLSGSTVRIERGASISGSIRAERSGGHVVGAEIRLRDLESGAVVSTLSTSDGAYAIESIAPGTYQLEVVSPSWVTTSEIVPVEARASIEKLLIARAASTIEGSVAETGGSAIAGATIVLGETMPESPDSSQVAYSGPDGRFVVRRIGTQREISLTVIKDGLPRVVSQPMQLPAGTRRRGVRIEVDRGVELTGLVVDRTGMELGGAFVSAVALDGAILEAAADAATGVADSEGKFHLTLPRGKFALEVSASGYATHTITDLVVNQTTAPLRIVMAEAVSIKGIVRRSGDDPVEGVYVTATAGTTVEMAVTDSEGRFTLTGVPEGRVELAAMKADEFINTTRVATAPSSNVVIEVGGGRSISGRVTDKTSGEPVTKFEIEIAAASAEIACRYATALPFASEDGLFSIANPPDGAVQLLVRAEGYAATKSERLSLDDGKSVSDVEIELASGGSVQGRVVDASGAAIPDVRIEPMEPLVANDPLGAIMPLAEARSDADGSYLIPEVSAGTSKILFRKAGYKVAERNVTVRGNTQRLDVRLDPIGEPDEEPSTAGDGAGVPASCAARVMGRVIGLDPASHEEVAVSVTTPSGRSEAEVDEAGAFSIDIPGGASSFAAELRDPARTVSSRTVQLTAACGSVTSAELAFGDVVARGRVVREGAPIADAMLSFVPQDDSLAPHGSVRLDSEGRFELPGLVGGSYLAVIRSARSLESFLVVADMSLGGDADLDIDGGRVSGRVVSRGTGRPVTGAVVSLDYRTNASARLTALTDSEGAFSFEALPQGAYELTIEHERHGKSTEHVELGDRDERAFQMEMN